MIKKPIFSAHLIEVEADYKDQETSLWVWAGPEAHRHQTRTTMSNSPSDPFHWQEFGTASQKGKLPDTDGNIRVQSGIELVPGRENNAVDSWRAQERLATGAPSLDNHQMQLELEAEIDSEKAAEDALLMRYGLDVLHLSPLLDSTGQPGTSTVNGSKVLSNLFVGHQITDRRRSG